MKVRNSLDNTKNKIHLRCKTSKASCTMSQIQSPTEVKTLKK